jgi:tRNA modification GTPase
VEAEGIRRARERAASADLVICVADSAEPQLHPGADMVVANKTDLAPSPAGMLGVSVLTGAGMSLLEAALRDRAARLANAGGEPVLTRARHVASVRDALAALGAAVACELPELRAENLRLALQSLGRITGAVDAEMILDDVFAAFCIGK